MTAPVVGLVAEQLFQRPSGGIGTYVRGLLGALPQAGVAVRPVVARHSSEELADAGVRDPVMSSLRRNALYESWGRFGRPRIAGQLDLVHAPSLAFPFADGRPLVVTVHDILFRTYPHTYTSRGVAFHERALRRLGNVAAVLCPSEAAAAAVRALPRCPAIVRVTPLGCDLRPAPADEVERTLRALGISRPYVLWMGTREPRKNLGGAIHGFAAAARLGIDPDTSLVLAGPTGWGDDPAQALIDRLGLAGRVSLPGFVAESSKAALLTGASAFLFPSLGEGFGLPALEAMACGVPVVASDRPSLPEVVGDAGLLVDPDDHDALGAQLARVLTEPGLGEELGRRGSSRAASFTWERTAAETAAVYREVLGT